MAFACEDPVAALPHTVFPAERKHYLQQEQPQQQEYQQQQQQPKVKQEQHVNYPPCFSPQLTRDYFQESEDETSAIQNQVSFILNFEMTGRGKIR